MCAGLTALLAAIATPAKATTSLGVTTSASPISVDFDETTGRMTVTVKPAGSYQGATWSQGIATTGNQTWTNGTIVTNPAPTDTSLTATATINGIPSVSVILQLDTTAGAGDLVVTLRNPSANLAGTPNKVINYPHPFYTSTTPATTGYAIVPINSGYVVPTSDTTFAPLAPVLSRHMEFIGGSDANNDGAWIGIIESHADATLALEQATVNSASHIGLTPSWLGSNENAAHTKELLSYDRVIRYHFFPTGGYVAVTKRFREYADSKGWLKTLAEKSIDNPAVLDLIGAPIIYLWGDGHDTAFPGILKAKGITKALLQLSTNHLDQFNKFPNNDFPDTSNWFTTTVHDQGFRGGFYDIYESTGSGTGYGGKVYLWPPAATSGAWATVKEDITKSGSYDICAAEQAVFASGTRLPAHVNRFHMDAAFFDVLITKNGVECYDDVNGHFETRADDLDSRAAVLNAAYSYFDPANPSNPPLLTGAEQARDWAVPYQVWGEGVQHLGKYDSQGTVSFPTVTGGWNGNTYPDVVTDMKVLTTGPNSQMASLLSEGYQVPLWDLVFHDCLLATLHWERAQNKFLYVWDHADLAAMIRGQTVLLNLVYNGAAGQSTDTTPAYVPNATSGPWSMRWQSPNDPDNLVQNRVLKTFQDVCGWHQEVGLMEMIDHQWLSTDRAVQMAEFSPDGGITGKGIIVNFGVYDGGTTGGKLPGVNWAKTIRGTSYSQANVAPNSYVKYSWTNSDTTAPTVAVTAPTNNATVSGTSTAVSANASDNVGVVGVQFKLDGVNLLTEDTTSPYGISWNTTTASPGSHTLTAVARDAAGNSTTSAGIGVTVSNGGDTTPPGEVSGLTATPGNNQVVLNWTNPTDGDLAGIMVRGKIGSYPSSTTDGILLLNDNVAPFDTTVNDTMAFNGQTFYYKVFAYDGVPNYSAGATASATPPGDTTAPTVAVTAPTNGATVSGTSTAVSANASDNVGVVGVQFKLDGANLGTEDTTSPYGITWNTTTASNGSHTLTAVARDAAGNSTTSAGISVTVNNTTGSSLTVYSSAANDGWILESSETSNLGGTNNATLNTADSLRLGDDSTRKQYRSIVSFDTSTLPDNAIIDSVTIRLTRGTVVGNNTNMTGFGALNVAIKGGSGFSNNVTLQNGDFSNTSGASPDLGNVVTGGLTIPTANGQQTTGTLISGALQYVNKTGTTQFRVDFGTDDDNDPSEDYMGFYSGENATNANKPQLVITYH